MVRPTLAFDRMRPKPFFAGRTQSGVQGQGRRVRGSVLEGRVPEVEGNDPARLVYSPFHCRHPSSYPSTGSVGDAGSAHSPGGRYLFLHPFRHSIAHADRDCSRLAVHCISRLAWARLSTRSGGALAGVLLVAKSNLYVDDVLAGVQVAARSSPVRLGEV